MLMRKTFKDDNNRNILVVAIVLIITFFSINTSLDLLNKNYLERKIEDENNTFMDVTLQLINADKMDAAVEYVEHYAHIHNSR
jgi:hypothetical protein